MKLEITDPENIKTDNAVQKPTASLSSRADASGPAPKQREIPVTCGKLQGFATPMFVITGLALCMGLTSCMVPYDSYGGGGATVTTYHPGYRVTSLPGGYRSEIISGATYYYHDGSYYRRSSGGYVVVDAPRGSRYYDDYGRRHQTNQPYREYRESDNRRDQRYERGEVITRLPDGYRVVNRRGNTYYQVGDRYYRRDRDGYMIVSSPY